MGRVSVCVCVCVCVCVSALKRLNDPKGLHVSRRADRCSAEWQKLSVCACVCVTLRSCLNPLSPSNNGDVGGGRRQRASPSGSPIICQALLTPLSSATNFTSSSLSLISCVSQHGNTHTHSPLACFYMKMKMHTVTHMCNKTFRNWHIWHDCRRLHRCCILGRPDV